MSLLNTLLLLVGLAAAADVEEDDPNDAYDAYWKAERSEYTAVGRALHQYKLDPSFSKVSAGGGVLLPLTWEGAQPGISLNIRTHNLEYGAELWTWEGENQGRFRLGYNTPFGPGIGRRPAALSGFRIRPIVGLGVGVGNVGWDFYTNPGLHVQVPFALLSIRSNLVYQTVFKTNADQYAQFKGLQLMPTVGIELDGLFDALKPGLTYMGTVTVGNTGGGTTPMGGGWVMQHPKTGGVTRDVQNYDMRPIWGITPRVGLPVVGQTSFGGGVTGRYSAFGGDAYVVSSAMRPAALSGPLKNTQDVADGPEALKGHIRTVEATTEASLDIGRLFLAVVRPKGADGLTGKMTPYTRFNLYLGPTLVIPGAVSFDDPAAAQTHIDAALGSGSTSAKEDPSQAATHLGTSMAIGLEIGPIMGRVNLAAVPAVGIRQGVEVAYMIPLTRLARLRAQRQEEP